MSIFTLSPETHVIEDHGEGFHYAAWKDNPGATEVEMLDVLYGLVRFSKPNLVVETGTLAGQGAYTLALACGHNGKGRVVSCDTNRIAIEYAQQHLKSIPNLEIIEHSSLTLPELREADFVFSDSGWDVRTKEYALVKPGCLFVVHDTHHNHEPNPQRLALFVIQNGGQLFQYGRGFGIIQKGKNDFNGGHPSSYSGRCPHHERTQWLAHQTVNGMDWRPEV